MGRFFATEVLTAVGNRGVPARDADSTDSFTYHYTVHDVLFVCGYDLNSLERFPCMR